MAEQKHWQSRNARARCRCRDRGPRRADRQKIGACVVVFIVLALCWSIASPPRPMLIWNASASSPVGLYRVAPAGHPHVGESVVAWPPEPARRLAVERGYVPADVPLIKRVAAVAGDRVCAAGEAVFVNGQLEAVRRTKDLRGRLLPGWHGCRILSAGELFLLMPDVGGSFDGRYFGATLRRDVIGRATLIWEP